VYLVSVALFYALLSVYVGRTVGIIRLLREVVTGRELSIIPFHPDGCGGLKPVGEIGLRNQYLLGLVGINVILHWSGRFFLDTNPLYNLGLALATAAYTIAGPLSFLGPLLPFRKGMREAKDAMLSLVSARMRQEIASVADHLRTPGGEVSKADEERIARLQKFGEVLQRLPVWPFDTSTLRKFSAAYVFPLLLMVSVEVFSELIRSYLIEEPAPRSNGSPAEVRQGGDASHVTPLRSTE
jgi:hypothetical protein